MITRSITRFAYTILILSVHFFSAPAISADAFSESKEIRRLLLEKNFSVLEHKLSAMQRNYKLGNLSDTEIKSAFDSFYTTDPFVGPILRLWVSQHRDSFVAQMAFAKYHHAKGWAKRSHKFMGDTRKEQVSGMRHEFAVARKAYKTALSLNPNLIVAYLGLIDISMNLDAREKTMDLAHRALYVEPESYEVRKKILFVSLPKWGGSLKEVKIWEKAAKTRESSNPRLRTLRGFTYFAVADSLHSHKNNCEGALDAINKAVKLGGDYSYYNERASIYYCLSKYDEAIKDINKSISIRPHYSSHYGERGIYYAWLQDYKRAIKDLSVPLLFDPLNVRYLRSRGKAFFWSQDYENAIKDLENGLTYGLYDSTVHYYLGRSYYYGRKDYRKTEKFLHSSLQLREARTDAWYWLAAAQWRNKNCEFVASARRYAQDCKKKNSCDSERYDWSVGNSAHAVKNGICEDQSPATILNANE